MIAVGLETITSDIETEGYFVKCIVNRSTAIFFPGTLQHRDIKQEGISYEDDYLGNAMAATIAPGTIDIRFHKSYSDELVQTIFSNLLGLPEMAWAAEFLVIDQGRAIDV